MPSDTDLLEPKSKVQMSRVSNGKKLVLGLDGRTRSSRRFRDLYRSLASDLGRLPMQAEIALIRQAATAIAASEQLQAKAISGAASVGELGELARLANVTTRILLALGIRKNKAGGPDLQSYLKAKAEGA